MKKIIFHIGTNKTGSTTLQNSLNRSVEILETHGVLYPVLSKYTHHTQLILSMIEDAEYRGAFGRNTPGGVERSKEMAESAWLKLEEQIAEKDYETLILSTEYAFGMRPQAWEKISKKLKTYADELHLVGYFRSPTSHFNSSQQQVLKYGHEIESPIKPLPYKGKVQKVNARAGAESVRVGLFDRQSLRGGDIVEDFLWHVRDITGQQIPALDKTDDNESVSAGAVRLLHSFNKLAFPKIRRPGNPTSKILLRAISEAEATLEKPPRPKLKPKVKEAIDAANIEEISWLKKEMNFVFPDFNFQASPDSVDEIAKIIEQRSLRPDDIFDEIDPGSVKALEIAVLKALMEGVFRIRGQEDKLIPLIKPDKMTASIEYLSDQFFPYQKSADVSWENCRRMYQKTLSRFGARLAEVEDLTPENIAEAQSFVMFELIKAIRKSDED